MALLYEVQPMGQLANLLATFKEVGGIIDYVLIGGLLPEDVADVYTFHHMAASFTIEAVTTRYPRSREKGPASRREPEKAQGTLIPPTEFFAPGYVWIPLQDLATFPHFTQEEREMYQTDWNVRLHNGMGYGFHNYHHAFRYPPYGLARYGEEIQELPETEQEHLFQAINSELLGDDMDALTIYSWSTDWADYFNDGHIWWGSFLWTVYSTQTQLLIGIAASTSD